MLLVVLVAAVVSTVAVVTAVKSRRRAAALEKQLNAYQVGSDAVVVYPQPSSSPSESGEGISVQAPITSPSVVRLQHLEEGSTRRSRNGGFDKLSVLPPSLLADEAHSSPEHTGVVHNDETMLLKSPSVLSELSPLSRAVSRRSPNNTKKIQMRERSQNVIEDSDKSPLLSRTRNVWGSADNLDDETIPTGNVGASKERKLGDWAGPLVEIGRQSLESNVRVECNAQSVQCCIWPESRDVSSSTCSVSIIDIGTDPIYQPRPSCDQETLTSPTPHKDAYVSALPEAVLLKSVAVWTDPDASAHHDEKVEALDVTKILAGLRYRESLSSALSALAADPQLLERADVEHGLLAVLAGLPWSTYEREIASALEVMRAVLAAQGKNGGGVEGSVMDGIIRAMASGLKCVRANGDNTLLWTSIEFLCDCLQAPGEESPCLVMDEALAGDAVDLASILIGPVAVETPCDRTHVSAIMKLASEACSIAIPTDVPESFLDSAANIGKTLLQHHSLLKDVCGVQAIVDLLHSIWRFVSYPVPHNVIEGALVCLMPGGADIRFLRDIIVAGCIDSIFSCGDEMRQSLLVTVAAPIVGGCGSDLPPYLIRCAQVCFDGTYSDSMLITASFGDAEDDMNRYVAMRALAMVRCAAGSSMLEVPAWKVLVEVMEGHVEVPGLLDERRASLDAVVCLCTYLKRGGSVCDEWQARVAGALATCCTREFMGESVGVPNLRFHVGMVVGALEELALSTKDVEHWESVGKFMRILGECAKVGCSGWAESADRVFEIVATSSVRCIRHITQCGDVTLKDWMGVLVAAGAKFPEAAETCAEVLLEANSNECMPAMNIDDGPWLADALVGIAIAKDTHGPGRVLQVISHFPYADQAIVIDAARQMMQRLDPANPSDSALFTNAILKVSQSASRRIGTVDKLDGSQAASSMLQMAARCGGALGCALLTLACDAHWDDQDDHATVQEALKKVLESALESPEVDDTLLARCIVSLFVLISKVHGNNVVNHSATSHIDMYIYRAAIRMVSCDTRAAVVEKACSDCAWHLLGIGHNALSVADGVGGTEEQVFQIVGMIRPDPTCAGRDLDSMVDLIVRFISGSGVEAGEKVSSGADVAAILLRLLQSSPGQKALIPLLKELVSQKVFSTVPAFSKLLAATCAVDSDAHGITYRSMVEVVLRGAGELGESRNDSNLISGLGSQAAADLHSIIARSLLLQDQSISMKACRLLTKMVKGRGSGSFESGPVQVALWSIVLSGVSGEECVDVSEVLRLPAKSTVDTAPRTLVSAASGVLLSMLERRGSSRTLTHDATQLCPGLFGSGYAARILQGAFLEDGEGIKKDILPIAKWMFPEVGSLKNADDLLSACIDVVPALSSRSPAAAVSFLARLPHLQSSHDVSSPLGLTLCKTMTSVLRRIKAGQRLECNSAAFAVAGDNKTKSILCAEGVKNGGSASDMDAWTKRTWRAIGIVTKSVLQWLQQNPDMIDRPQQDENQAPHSLTRNISTSSYSSLTSAASSARLMGSARSSGGASPLGVMLDLLAAVLRHCDDDVLASHELMEVEELCEISKLLTQVILSRMPHSHPQAASLTGLAKLSSESQNILRSDPIVCLALEAMGALTSRIRASGFIRPHCVYYQEITSLAASPSGMMLPAFILNSDLSDAKDQQKREVSAGPLPGWVASLPALFRRMPEVFDLGTKLRIFRHAIPLRDPVDTYKIKRCELVPSALKALLSRSKAELRQRWKVEFEGETGIDIKGVRRELVTLLSHELFKLGGREASPSGIPLFIEGSSGIYHPNPRARSADHIRAFEAAGRLLGKCLVEGELMDVRLARVVYKRILQERADYHDVLSVDPEFYRQRVEWILHNDITDIIFEKFVHEGEELCPGGSRKVVTEDNKNEYVALLVQHRIRQEMDGQLKAIAKGFNDVVGLREVQTFSVDELEEAICGDQDVKIGELTAACRFTFGYTSKSRQIQWLWEVLREGTDDDRRRLLQFVTGSPRVPVGGCRALSPQFTIQRISDETRLPSASTCFNLLKLPQYSSKEILREKLALVLREGLPDLKSRRWYLSEFHPSQ